MDGKSSQHTSSLFQRLKPVCINITKNCSVDHLKEAITTIKSLKKCDIKEIAMLEYVLFPFRLTLQKRKVMKEEQEILCFTCLQVIFSKCDPSVIRDEIISWCLNTFSLYFVSKNFNEDDRQKEKLVSDDISEERKSSIVKFIQSMFLNMNAVSMTTLYHDKYLPVLGHVISILLYMIEMEKNRELQVLALKCLKTLSGSSFDDEYCSKAAGKCWASFLPGVCMTFNRLFSKGNNMGQNQLATSLDTFAHLIYVVMNDSLNSELITTETSLEQLLGSKMQNIDLTNNNDKTSINNGTRNIGVKRTKEWLQTTSANLNLVFKNIFPVLMCHQKAKVQLALLLFIDKLLLSCMNTLASSIMDFLDILLKHSCDETEEARNESNRILNESMKKFQDTNIASIKSALTERLYNELLSLPRVMHSSNDEMKLAKLQVIKGYMEFYGKNMRETLNTYALLQRFVTSLIHILELETDNVNLVEEQISIFRQAIDTGPETYDNRFYRKNFRSFRSIKIYKLIKDIIHVIANYGNIELLVDYLLEQSRNSMSCKQSFLILNELILAMDFIDRDKSNSIIDSVLSSYLDDQYMKLPVSNKIIHDEDMVYSDELMITQQDTVWRKKLLRNSIPFEILNSNIQLICILLEGLSNCAEVLKTEFNIWMIQILYILLEKVGCTNAAISLTAIETLNNVVRFCDYKDISDLIFANSDYLLNSTTLQFRRLSYGAAAPAVLCVVLRFCDASLIPIISDVIGEVFTVLDEYQEEVADDMLLVLKHYNIAVDKCYGCELTEPSQCRIKKKTFEMKLTNVSNNVVSVKDFIEEYCEINLHSEGILNEKDYEDIKVDEEVEDNRNGFEVQDEEFMNEQDRDETKEEIPFHYNVVIKALEKCVAFTAAKQSRIKLKAMDVVLHGVHALKSRENDLLPLIHKLWPPVICRLKDKDPILALKAFDVVCGMVEYSGNFMTKRITTDFLPFAVKLLKENYPDLAKDKCNFTQLSKMLNKLISFLGDVIPTLEVSTELFCNISSTIFLYINNNIHQSIQETAVSTLHKFYIHRPNVIWLCQFMYTSDNWTSIHNILKPLNYVKLGSEADQYRNNILILQNIIKGGCNIMKDN